MDRARRRALLAAGCLPFSMGALQQALARGNLPVLQGVNQVRGEVRVNGALAIVGTPVNLGDTVVTGPDGEVVFVIGDNAFVLRARSQVRIDGSSPTRMALRVLTGALATVFGKGEHRVVAANATVGIRGTAAYFDTTMAETYFCLCYGSADLAPGGRPELARQLTTRYHDTPFWIGTDGNVRAAPVIGHGDAELIFLEGLFDRRPPFMTDGTTRRY